MIIKNQIVKNKWNKNNKKWYIEKGYKFTNIGDEFYVQLKDLKERTKIKVRAICDYCGKEYMTTISAHEKSLQTLNKCCCSSCAQLKSSELKSIKYMNKTYKKCKEICNEKGYILISPKDYFYNCRYYFYYICPKHGIKKAQIDNFIHGHYCYECGRLSTGNKMRIDKDFVKKDIEQNGKFEVLNIQDYTTNKNVKNLFIKCNTCGKINFTSYANFKRQKYGCVSCASKINSSKIRLDIFEVKYRVEKYGNKLINETSYKNNQEKNLEIKCGNCKRIFLTNLSNYENSLGSCPYCATKKSKGEDKIRLFLDKHNIIYETQKKFNDCKDDRMLSYDFFIKEKNTLIEYNGGQHYFPVPWFGGEKSFEKQIKHDNLKSQYAKNNNYNLLIIPYWDFKNIEKILKERLNV